MDLGEIHDSPWGADPSHLWAQAQGAVQSDLDQEVLWEAAGLADAELADMTLAARLKDSLGHWIGVDFAGVSYQGQLAGVTTSGDWICLNGMKGDMLIRVGAVQRFTGLRQVVTPAHVIRSHFREKHWLRDNLGSHVRLRTFAMGSPVLSVGALIEVGADFIAIRTPVPYGDHSVIDTVPYEQIALVESKLEIGPV